MKYINLQKLKLICFVLVLFIGQLTMVAQEEQFDQLTSEDYQLINDFYSLGDSDQPIKIYYRTYFDKGWTHFFTNIDAVLKQGGGLGTTVSDEELKQILTGKVLRKIRNEIDIAIPLQLNSRKLSDKIELVKSFDSRKALKEGVVRITNPIIINNEIAVFRAISLLDGPIFILQKKKGKWTLIYTIFQWLILE